LALQDQQLYYPDPPLFHKPAYRTGLLSRSRPIPTLR
jgi:hypothetical protein